MTETLSRLDPIEIAFTGLSHFMQIYKVKENATAIFWKSIVEWWNGPATEEGATENAEET